MYNPCFPTYRLLVILHSSLMFPPISGQPLAVRDAVPVSCPALPHLVPASVREEVYMSDVGEVTHSRRVDHINKISIAGGQTNVGRTAITEPVAT